MRTSFAFGFAVLGLLIGGAAAARAEEPEKPAVLFAGFPGVCNHEVAARLHAAGFALNQQAWPPGLDEVPLRFDELKKYNAIVLMALGNSNADFSLNEKNKQNLAALRQYLSAGGGILYLPCRGQTLSDVPVQDAFLKSLGLAPWWDELPFDADTAIVGTPWKIAFAHTTNIAKSPLTQGVTDFWYPTATRAGGENHTIPFHADKEWTVVVRGEKSSYSRTFIGGLASGMEACEKKGKCDHEVPLAAYRTVGKGRMVFLGLTPEYLFGHDALTTLEAIVLDRGLKQVPSHGYKLIENSLKWLAEPTLADRSMGGAAMNAAMLQDRRKTKFGQPFNWSAKVQFPAIEPAYSGVIGARTTYSNGKASVDQWVAAAKEKGLSYLVFLEEFAQLSPGNFKQLSADCARHCSPTFAAIPGFAIDDELGNHYFYFGQSVPYPKKALLSADGKVFVSYDPEVNAKNPHVKGQLNMTVLDYVNTFASYRLTAGNYSFKQSAAPFVNWFSLWDAVGVLTYRDGQLVEDASRGYLQLVDFGQGPLPLVIDRMDHPDQLLKSGWRTVLRLPKRGGQLVGGKVSAEQKLSEYWSQWQFYPDNPSRIYITEGPAIESWSVAGSGDYAGDNKDDFTWQNYRFQVHGRVTSPAGLQEVAVVDGERPFRRFLPQGAKQFEFTLDLANDRQHTLVLTATDMRGKRAISGDRWNRNHRIEEVQCGDRDNQLPYGYLTTRDGYGLIVGGNQCLSTPDKRVDPKCVSPAGTFKNDSFLGAPAFDGAAGGEPVWSSPVSLRVASGEIAAPTVSESRRLFHSGDVQIGEGRWERYFTDNITAYNVWHTLWRTEPAKDFAVTKRNLYFNVDPDSPLAVFLWRVKVTLLRDLDTRGIMVGVLQPADSRLWTIRGSDQSVCTGTWEETVKSSPRTKDVPFSRGGYVAHLDSPLGGAAVFSLTDGLRVQQGLPNKQAAIVVLPGENSPQKKGQTKEIDLLLVGIPRPIDRNRHMPAPTTEIVDRFYRDFGLDGGKTGYTLDAKEGRLVAHRYVLDVDGAATQCFSGSLKGDLISSLPIRVSGLHDRWSAYLYDRTLKKARPVGVFENKAWAMVRLHGGLNVFIGHPIVCDRAELTLQLTQSGDRSWTLEIHNPTAQAVRTTLRKNAAFDPLVDKELKDAEIDVPAGQSVTRSL